MDTCLFLDNTEAKIRLLWKNALYFLESPHPFFLVKEMAKGHLHVTDFYLETIYWVATGFVKDHIL